MKYIFNSSFLLKNNLNTPTNIIKFDINLKKWKMMDVNKLLLLILTIGLMVSGLQTSKHGIIPENARTRIVDE